MIEVYRAEVWPGHPYPWRFSVTWNGRRHVFAGIPNQCATKREATARAAWRLKWMKEGTFEGRYR